MKIKAILRRLENWIAILLTVYGHAIKKRNISQKLKQAIFLRTPGLILQIVSRALESILHGENLRIKNRTY